jgi:hypothetical protein
MRIAADRRAQRVEVGAAALALDDNLAVEDRLFAATEATQRAQKLPIFVAPVVPVARVGPAGVPID